MARARQSIRGKGASIFEPQTEGEQHAGTTARQHAGIPAQRGPRYPKATFYLPESLLTQLDRAWLAQRSNDSKCTKSALVAQALEAYLEERPAK
jgi:hypothetical protein